MDDDCSILHAALALQASVSAIRLTIATFSDSNQVTAILKSAKQQQISA
jgi:hypothetical protein